MARGERSATRPAPVWADPVPVKEWMTTPVATIRADARVREGVELMKRRRIRHLPVVDEGDRLIGIVTDRDIRQIVFDPLIQERLGDRVQALSGLTVREIMTWGVMTVRPDTGIRQAARLMREQKVGALPVVDDGRVVGILTERDLLRAFDALVRDRVATVRPLMGAPAPGGVYEYGLPEPCRDEAWPDEVPGS